MIINEKKITIFEIQDEHELEPGDLGLLEKAREAVGNAYAPYSGYHVGAAVRLANGVTVQGNNQENVAYPDGMCAERVALFYASSQYPDIPVQAVAITARAADFLIDSPVTPCGSCRQVMAEWENRYNQGIRLILQGEAGIIYLVDGVDNLLPLMFRAENLKKKSR
ncbi:MAG: cytidine deaminase [Bacteroidales bacterium]|nr:cytidine deaminase [Bacteroidales bacterium]